MSLLRIECLHCGEVRTLRPAPGERLEEGECSRCRYVGWAPSAVLDERLRRLLRVRPPERRRLMIA